MNGLLLACVQRERYTILLQANLSARRSTLGLHVSIKILHRAYSLHSGASDLAPCEPRFLRVLNPPAPGPPASS